MNMYNKVYGMYMKEIGKGNKDKHSWKEVRQLLWDKGIKGKELLDTLKRFGTRVYGSNATANSCKRTYVRLEEFKEWLKDNYNLNNK